MRTCIWTTLVTKVPGVERVGYSGSVVSISSIETSSYFMKSNQSQLCRSLKPLQNAAREDDVACGTGAHEHMPTEQALSENQQRLRAIVYGSPIPQFVLGEDHTIISWNGALE